MLVFRWLSGYVCIRVPMVLLSDVVYYSLLLDAIGAFGVVIWMILWFLCLHIQNDDTYEPHHWTMWALQEDRENTAARLLVALLEFILGIVLAVVWLVSLVGLISAVLDALVAMKK